MEKRKNFSKEFPFIRESCGDIEIKKMDGILAQYVPKKFFQKDYFYLEEEEQVDLVLEDGEIISNAVNRKEWKFDPSQKNLQDGELIIEAILRHNVAKKIKFIVIYKKGKHNQRSGFVQSGQFIKWHNCVIYKLNPKFDIYLFIEDWGMGHMNPVQIFFHRYPACTVEIDGEEFSWKELDSFPNVFSPKYPYRVKKIKVYPCWSDELKPAKRLVDLLREAGLTAEVWSIDWPEGPKSKRQY